MIKNPDYTREGPYDDAAREYVRDMSKRTGQYIDQFTTVPDPRTPMQKVDDAMARKPKCCQPGWKLPIFPKPKPLDPETEARFENERRDTAKMLGRHRRQCRLRTGREVG